jgi:hypothetical protein
MSAGLSGDMQERLGQDLSDVRLHDDRQAAESAAAVAADAYTVGRHVVFAAGRYAPGSESGKELLAHELTHTASSPAGAAVPSGRLRVSHPAEAAERHAVEVSRQGKKPVATVAGPAAGLFRQAAPAVALTSASVNHTRVTVPPIAALSFTARKTPANATGVSFSLVGDDASIATATVIDSSSGAITVDAAQTGGSAHVEAQQTLANPGGGSTIQTFTVPFNFTAIPSGITSTSANATAPAGFYGGQFTHTFTSPAGGQTALHRSHVNERFPAAAGTSLALTGSFGPLTIHVNNPNSAAAGWDLDAAGTMVAADNVTWGDRADARPFVTTASNPTPTATLPQALTATQEFRNLSFPDRVYANTAVATTTHRRALELQDGRIVAVTSANAAGIDEDVEQDYRGPTVFHNCQADPASVRMSLPTPPGGAAPAVDTSTITVTMDGADAAPNFRIHGNDLGSQVDSDTGVFTPGQQPGKVIVRAGSAGHYDEAAVTIERRALQFIRLQQDRTVAEIIQQHDLGWQNVDAAALQRLNPELTLGGPVTAGTLIWLTAREVAANATGFEEIAERYFGSRHKWPRLWGFNPQIQDPSSITAATRIHLQSAADRTSFGEIPVN